PTLFARTAIKELPGRVFGRVTLPESVKALAEEPPVTGRDIQMPEGAQPPSDVVRNLMQEGVNRPDAEALVAGTKSVKDVVEGAFSKFITPAWDASRSQTHGGHAEAWVAGYDNAVHRLQMILGKEPATEGAQPKETDALQKPETETVSF